MAINYLLAMLVFAGPWVDSPHFPRAKQEAAMNATLRLTNPATRGEGTAVRIGKVGIHVYYLTAQHCLENTKVINLESFSAAIYPKVLEKIDGANIVHEWPEIDLALIRSVEQSATSFLSITKEPSGLGQNFPVLTVGCSDPEAPTIFVDEVLRAREVKKKPDQPIGRWHWETKKQPEKGRSGGPLISASGNLIGICSGLDGDKKRGYYIHESAIRKALNSAGYGNLLVSPLQPAKSE